MPKAERGTPKDIANRQKAKGLQKLRWYCQMCQKQCRDENGFKCHIMSESHQRQLLLCAANPDKFQDEFSKQFLGDFLDLLRRRWGTKRVWNNAVYNEYIMDRDHVHMNSTKWLTLSEFTEWLGKNGYCEVDYQEGKGWFMAYIDNDPQTLARKKELRKMMKKKDNDEAEQQARIAKLIEDGKIKEARAIASAQENELKRQIPREIGEENSQSDHPTEKKPKMSEKKAVSLANVEIKTISKKLPTERERWICRGAVVKVMQEDLEGFYKKKGFIEECVGKKAVVQLINSKKRAKIPEKYLETVIPSEGRPVIVVKGELAKKTGILKKINQKEFCVVVEVDLTENESTEAIFKFDEITKKYE